jgi:hypothetical protein
MLQDFRGKLAESQDRAGKSAKELKLSIQDYLKGHDNKLCQVEELSDNLEPDTLQGKASTDRSSKLASKLVEYVTEEVTCRLDRIYLQTLHEPPGDLSPHEIKDQDASALKEELDSLYSEIRVLAEMAVQQEFLSPIIKTIHMQENRIQDDSEVRLDYVSQY